MSSDTALLERAASYSLAALDTVTPDLLSRPTPCAGWDLHTLLRHTYSSVVALHEGVEFERVTLVPADDEPVTDLVEALCVRVTALLQTWPAPAESCGVTIADRWLPMPVLAASAALELTVHGWDISQASGRLAPIPLKLASELGALSRLLVPDDARRRRLFAPVIHLAAPTRPDEALLAFLGRCPVAGRQAKERARP